MISYEYVLELHLVEPCMFTLKRARYSHNSQLLGQLYEKSTSWRRARQCVPLSRRSSAPLPSRTDGS